MYFILFSEIVPGILSQIFLKSLILFPSVNLHLLSQNVKYIRMLITRQITKDWLSQKKKLSPLTQLFNLLNFFQ